MNRHRVQLYGKWVAGLLLILWFIGRWRGTWFGDPVFDRFLAANDGDVVAALIDAENPRLNAQVEIENLCLEHRILRQRMPNLQYSNAVLQYVRQVTTIRALTIGPSTDIDDRGLQGVGQMVQLETLGLNGLPITDAGLEHLHSVKNLQLLTACATNCSQAGIDAFQQAVPDCEVLWGPRQ